MNFSIVPTTTHAFTFCRSTPAHCTANQSDVSGPKKHQVNLEYKALRRKHAISAMCDVLSGNVTGQGIDDLTRAVM